MDRAKRLRRRFGGLLPVVIDCETGGYDPEQNALLEVAAVVLGYGANDKLVPEHVYHYHVQPFPGSQISQESLEVTQIRPDHPFRFAQEESVVLEDLTKHVRAHLTASGCRRAVLVGHNAQFDLSFIHAAYTRCDRLKLSPFHRFTTMDTATIGGVFYSETVLARVMRRARLDFDLNEAHSALYDAKRTAELFCQVVNRVDEMG